MLIGVKTLRLNVIRSEVSAKKVEGLVEGIKGEEAEAECGRKTR
jgi:hypothetical protein